MRGGVSQLAILAVMALVVSTSCAPAAPVAPAAAGQPAAAAAPTTSPAAASAASSGSTTSPGVTADTISFGGIGTMTGPASFVGLGGRDGFQLALDEINATPINGRKIQISWEDDAGAPATALAAAKKLIEQQNLFAIFGSQGSNSAVALIDYADTNKVPFYNTSAGADTLVTPVHKYIFTGASMPISSISKGIVGLALDFKKAKSPAMLSPTDVTGKAFAQWETKWLNDRGVTVVAAEENAPGDVDYTAQLTKIKAANPDLVILNGVIPDVAVILKQAQELGLTMPMIGSTSSSGDAMLAAAGPAANGFQSGWLVPYYATDTSPANQAFIAKYKAKYPNAPVGRPNYLDYFGYADAFVIAEGLKRAGGNPTRESFVNALETISDFKGTDVASPRTFTPTNHAGNTLLSFIEARDGKYVRVEYQASTQ
jgi:branched-chain amino acid transport system substrate-binding protein